jgi:hypothetical protein
LPTFCRNYDFLVEIATAIAGHDIATIVM